MVFVSLIVGLSHGGLGLFTTMDRASGDTIASYAGKRISLRGKPQSAIDEVASEYIVRITNTEFIDATEPTSCAVRFSNTARRWNIAAKECRGNNASFAVNRMDGGSVSIRATSNIRAGEEILTAYGSSFHISDCLRR